jgi:peptidoglycan/xylan/chitin deacetylase (PgdA/CDA1 family)
MVNNKKLRKEMKLLGTCCLLLLTILGGFQANPQQVTAQSSTKYVSILFDDGLQDQFDQALPVLLQYGFKASFGIITADIGGDSRMGQSQLQQLAAQGMDIGSHSKTHPDLTAGLTDEQM